jgi:hypothetical protein
MASGECGYDILRLANLDGDVGAFGLSSIHINWTMADDLHILNQTPHQKVEFLADGSNREVKYTTHGPEGITRGVLSRENDRSVDCECHVKASTLAGYNE